MFASSSHLSMQGKTLFLGKIFLKPLILMHVMANMTGNYYVVNPKTPINMMTTTIQQTATTVAEETAQKPAGWFDFLGRFWAGISPYMPFILGAGFLLFIIFLVISWVRKGDKLFQKDYDKEAYKAKKEILTRNPARVSSIGLLVVMLITLVTLVLSAIVVFALFLFKIIGSLSFAPIIIAAVIALLGSMTMTMMMPTVFNSYSKVVNQKGEVIGHMLSGVRTSADGFMDCLIFKKTKWLIFIDDEVLSVPLNDKCEWDVLNKKTGKTEKKSINLKSLPKDKRFWHLSNGDLLINCIDIHKTKHFIYPLYGKMDGDVYDLSEFALVREMGLADRINQYDLANTSRENAIILAQGNPYKRLQPAGTSSANQQESENS